MEAAEQAMEALKVANIGKRYSTVRYSYDRNTIITNYYIVVKKKDGTIKRLPKEYTFDGNDYDLAKAALVTLKAEQDAWMEEKGITDRSKLPSYHIQTKEKGGEGQVKAQIYFKKDMADMLNNFLAQDKIRNNAFFGITGRKMMDWKNQYTSIEFALSMFHAMTIMQELIASNAAWRYGRARENKDLSFKEVLRGYNPVAAMREAREIAALMDAVLSDTSLAQDPAFKKKAQELFRSNNADVLDAIIQFYDAGGLQGQDRSLQSHVHHQGDMRYRDGEANVSIVNGELVIELPKGDRLPAWLPGPFKYAPFSKNAIKESFTQVWKSQIKEHPNHPLTAAFKTGKFALMEGTTAWLMEQGIPRIKMAMWAREYTLELDRQAEHIKAGTTNKEFIARNTMKFIEDRFGEVNWMNTWMNPSYKTALQMAFRSFTWFTGSWNALAKAGIDIGKLGWFTLKGEKYELTSRGLWAMNAIVAHMMAVSLITVSFSMHALAIGGGEDDDEEIGLLSRMLFPRVDPLDPQKRVSIPSYVTEWYKLFRHVGIIGTHAEPSKLISGRFNSILGKGIDLLNNSDFRGVTIRNEQDNLIQQTVDSLLHMAPLPISMSVATKNYKAKGFQFTDLGLSTLGFVDAPAAAKRSKAANLAFEVRREEYKGSTIAAEDMELKDETKRAAYQYGQGNKGPLNELLREQKISKEQYKNALKRIPLINGRKNPLYEDPLTSAMGGLTLEGAFRVWQAMTDKEKATHRQAMLKKYQNTMRRGYRSGEFKKEVTQKMKELKILR
jgi:hypothetical protein